MSKRVGDKFYICKEEDAKCEYCGKVAELRPYGKDGANICFECGMKDEKATEEMLLKNLEGVTLVLIGNPENLN